MESVTLLRRSATLSLFACGLLAGTAAGQAADVTYERLLNPEPGNWLTHHMTYNANRYSTLDEINRDSVKGLKVAFTVPLAPPEKGAFANSALHATPLIDDGMYYISDGWGRVYAIDVKAGDRAFIRWIMDPETDRETDGITNNRGVAILGSTVYSVTLDGQLVATNIATGEVEWQVPTEDNPAEYFTMAPLAINGKIIMGPAGGDGPMRGRLEARDAESGDQVWKFNIIPGPGEAGHETWAGNTWEVGGAAVWSTGSFDPAQNLLVWGTGNPQPDFDPKVRAGDNLYSDSTIALDADAGTLKWYFQYTPNDGWDYDEVGTQQIYEVNGQTTVGHFGRNGFFYNLDAVTGAFVNGTQYHDVVNWTAGIDPKTGKPIEYDPNNDYQPYKNDESRIIAPTFQEALGIFCPYIEGGVNFYPTSFSHRTKYVYGTAIEGCADWRQAALSFPEGAHLTGSVTAIDTATGQKVAKLNMPFNARGGVLSTAGGIIFGASSNGDFYALNDETLERLWNFNVGTTIEAPPVTYTVNGKQYIAVAVGPGGIGMDFHDYPARGDDPNAPAYFNIQPTSMLYFFAL